jgi:hypothetical protein
MLIFQKVRDEIGETKEGSRDIQTKLSQDFQDLEVGPFVLHGAINDKLTI